MMAHALSQVSHVLSLCESSLSLHIPASTVSCRLWDPHLEEEDLVDYYVESTKFSEDGSLLAAKQRESLELWKTSNSKPMWSVPCSPTCSRWLVYFSPDGLRVLVSEGEKFHAYDVGSGCSLGKVDSVPKSMYDHVHWHQGEMRDKWKCDDCENLLLTHGEYWFTDRDRWLWIVEAHVARRLIQIPSEYDILGIRGCQGYVAARCLNGLLMLDTTHR